MKEDLITLETRILAKKKGFEGFPYYTQSVLQKWLREKHDIHTVVHYQQDKWCYSLEQLPPTEDKTFAKKSTCQDRDIWLNSILITPEWWMVSYNTYEEALERGLKEALNLVKDI
jgi:uncharacterized protein (DUF2126 family)